MPRTVKCTQEGCELMFTDASHMRRHVRNTHEQHFKHHCDVCYTGFDCAKRLAAHQKTHTPQDKIQKATARVYSSVLMHSVERACEQAWTLTRDCLKTCKAGVCAVSHSRRTANSAAAVGAASSSPAVADESLSLPAFKCGDCKRSFHYVCEQYPPELEATFLQTVLCRACVVATAPQEPNAMVRACVAAQLLQGVVQQVYNATIKQIDPDGTCFLRSVIAAGTLASGTTAASLLRAVLADDKWSTYTFVQGPGGPDVETLRQTLLSYSPSHLVTSLRTNWSSELFDRLPEAVAQYLRRPLHIISVAHSGEIWEQRLSTRSADGDSRPPIRLVRTLESLRLDHYDAVIPAE